MIYGWAAPIWPILMSIRACFFFSRTFVPIKKKELKNAVSIIQEEKKNKHDKNYLFKDIWSFEKKRIFNTPIFFCYCDPLLKACYGCWSKKLNTRIICVACQLIELSFKNKLYFLIYYQFCVNKQIKNKQNLFVYRYSIESNRVLKVRVLVSNYE